ncbi:MAG TPA: C40 family peptidase [Micromonosporaceae bacterium]|nr:C40 family peptidase [Micromonosporaceae bacterium]
MTGKAITGIVTGLLLIIVTSVGGLGLGAASITLTACTNPRPGASNGAANPAHPGFTSPTGRTWTTEQTGNAAIIVAEGTRMRVPPRGWIIAVAVAMQESQLRNLGNLGAANDHDSLGLFQQRPSQGWGTPAQILNPYYAAAQFYQHLTGLPRWQDLPLTVAGQRVQISGHPDAYAKWEDDAIAVVDAVGPTTTGMPTAEFIGWLGMCAALGADGQPPTSTESLPDGFAFPPGTPPTIVAALTWALAQLGTPYFFGGDCTDAHSSNPAHHCDCSSLVQQAYRAAGIHLPRTTTQQVHAGAAVHDIDRLRPGDLLFIPGSDGTPTNPRHVGLYLGNGLLIHAPRSGHRVKVVKQSSWHGQLIQIRRIVTHPL